MVDFACFPVFEIYAYFLSFGVGKNAVEDLGSLLCRRFLDSLMFPISLKGCALFVVTAGVHLVSRFHVLFVVGLLSCVLFIFLLCYALFSCILVIIFRFDCGVVADLFAWLHAMNVQRNENFGFSGFLNISLRLPISGNVRVCFFCPFF